MGSELLPTSAALFCGSVQFDVKELPVMMMGRRAAQMEGLDGPQGGKKKEAVDEASCQRCWCSFAARPHIGTLKKKQPLIHASGAQPKCLSKKKHLMLLMSTRSMHCSSRGSSCASRSAR